MARILPNPILHLNAARAAGGTGAGSNTVPTSEWYDLSGNGNHGALTGFDYEPGNRPRTNVETDKALWHDLSGNGNDGTLTGFSAWDGVTDGWATGPDRLVFAGDDDCCNCGDVGAAEDALFACEVWFTTTSSGVNIVLAAEGNTASSTPFWDLFMTTAALLQFNVRNDANVISSATVPGLVNDGALHHACAIRAGDGKLYIYRDGSNAGGYNPAAPALPLSLNTADIGVLRRDAVSGYFAGSILRARMYRGYAPSAAEVAQNYAAGPTGTDYVRDGLVLDLNAARAVRPSGWVEL